MVLLWHTAMHESDFKRSHRQTDIDIGIDIGMGIPEGKVPPGCLSVERVTSVTGFSMPLEARLWHYSAELSAYPLCALARSNTTDNPSEMCPLKLTDFCLFLYH